MGSYEHSSESSGSVQCWESLKYLGSCLVHNEGHSSMELVSLISCVTHWPSCSFVIDTNPL